MSTSKNKSSKSSAKSLEKQMEERVQYIDKSVQDYSISDFVRVKSFPRGMLLSFGKVHPDNDNILLFKEILLPFDVAAKLGEIINKQILELIEDGRLVGSGKESEE